MTNTERTNQIESEITNMLELLNPLLGYALVDEEEDSRRKKKIARLNASLVSKDLELVDEDSIQSMVTNIEKVDLLKIAREFKKPSKGKWDFPRVNFLGNFKYLSMTDQRHICKSLGFEYYKETPFGVAKEDQMFAISMIWTHIHPEYTKLIVIGDTYKFYDIKRQLYLKHIKEVKSRGLPLFQKYNIPLIMESEFIKLHKDYPSITMGTLWTTDKLTKLIKSN